MTQGRRILLAGGVVAFGLTAGIFVYILLTDMRLARDFDPEIWRAEAGNPDGDNPRNAMVEDLRGRLPRGTPRAEVRALLGPPDGTGDGRDVYSLGRGDLAPDFDMLEVRYDAADRLIGLRRIRS